MPAAVDVVSTTGEAPSTFTVSATPAIVNFIGSVTV